jgi:hypothetical protein
VLSISPATRVFVALNPVDMRLGFNGLYALTQTVLNQQDLSGHLFVFTKKRRNRMRVLFWDGASFEATLAMGPNSDLGNTAIFGIAFNPGNWRDTRLGRIEKPGTLNGFAHKPVSVPGFK